jgi:hypothetical protein
MPRPSSRIVSHSAPASSASSSRVWFGRPWRRALVIEQQGAVPRDFDYTGYLLGPDTVLTCWHGSEYFSGRAQVAIFSHALAQDGAAVTDLPVSQLRSVAAYRAVKPPPAGDRGSCSGDWVILQLEHPVTHLGPLAPPRLEAPRPGRAVYTLGHPLGLPLKLATGGAVVSASDGAFRTSLDTFAGNSGSPVFDAGSHALLGLVIEGQKGQDDFEPAPARRCYVTNRIDGPAEGQLSVPVACFATAVPRCVRSGLDVQIAVMLLRVAAGGARRRFLRADRHAPGELALAEAVGVVPANLDDQPVQLQR